MEGSVNALPGTFKGTLTWVGVLVPANWVILKFQTPLEVLSKPIVDFQVCKLLSAVGVSR